MLRQYRLDACRVEARRRRAGVNAEKKGAENTARSKCAASRVIALQAAILYERVSQPAATAAYSARHGASSPRVSPMLLVWALSISDYFTSLSVLPMLLVRAVSIALSSHSRLRIRSSFQQSSLAKWRRACSTFPPSRCCLLNHRRCQLGSRLPPPRIAVAAAAVTTTRYQKPRV